ncbi:MAG: D-alanyl-D-alanine carboxypeptidase [Ruminococcaceae bacterium]|nr:D-alanyl-D-alanine carboxypeptidase [Oscillospiraceae bacterium]
MKIQQNVFLTVGIYKKEKKEMKKVIALIALFITLTTSFPMASRAKPVERPEITSENNICVLNIETGECPMKYDADVKVSVAATAKMMTAIVAYESLGDLSALLSVPEQAADSTYIGPAGLISAPRLGLTVGKEYTVKDLLCALLVSSANDAGITLAYHAGGGDIGAFVGKMNEKAASFGASNTNYLSPVGLDDGSYTTAYDSALIAYEFSKISTLVDISSAGRSVTLAMGTLHNKNYLTSDFLIRDYKLNSVKGICAGQANEEGGYCLIAYYASNELSYIICIMDSSSEKRDTQAGTRWFDEGNAYSDVHKIVPWLKESFEIRTIISPESSEFSFSIPVKLSAKKDSVMTMPTETVSALTDITAEKINYVPEPTFYQTSLEAPVKEGTVVGEVNLYKNGVLIATVPLVTKEGAERSEMLATMKKVTDFMESDTLLLVIKAIIILAVIFVVWSFGSFVVRIIKKYKNGMSKDYYPPAD